MKRTIIITILFSLLSAISTYLLFDSMEGFKKEVKESKIAVKEMQSQVNAIENKYKSEIQYWVIKNSSLQRKIQQTDIELKESKRKASSLQGRILLLISGSKKLQDTVRIISNCDSIKENVNRFITETNVKERLCDKEVSGLKILVQNKDSALAVCERGFFAIKGLTDFSLVQQTALAENLKLSDKKLRKENRKTKFLSAAVFVLSGVSAALLLQK